MANALIDSILDVFPEEGDAREELIALAVVTAGVVCNVPMESRAELVDTFCSLLRKSTAIDLN